MKISIVGTGMDGGVTLTREAEKAIADAEVLIGAKRVTEPFADSGKKVFISHRPDEISAYIAGCGAEKAAVLMSGDCGFYSGAQKLIPLLAGYETRVIPGISTPVCMCAKFGLSWQDMKFVSLHGADGNIVRNVRRHKNCFFLLGGDITPADICKKLIGYGTENVTVYIGARLGYDDEFTASGTPAELSGIKPDGLCAVITVNEGYEGGARFGIPDTEFERGKVPMTKSEIRAAVMSKLGVRDTDIVWDVGCGTGSVSVECALAANDGTVYAADSNDEAVQLTELNAHRFGCDNIRVVSGRAPEALKGLPNPDKLFIGGAGGKIAVILDAALTGGKCKNAVITAVTLETLNEAVTALKERGLAVNTSQISAVRTRTVGSHTMFDAQNPVFIIEGVSE